MVNHSVKTLRHYYDHIISIFCDTGHRNLPNNWGFKHRAFCYSIFQRRNTAQIQGLKVREDLP